MAKTSTSFKPGHPAPSTAFKPGVSGNPGGRPAFSDVSDATRRLLREPPSKRAPTAKTRAEAIAFSMIRRAADKPRELELLLDRAEGKVPQAHEVTGRDGAPILDEAEVAARIAALMAKGKK